MTDKNIKKISDFKEDIHRCSKCGICQAACPIFKATGNECTVSRGQFIMLDGVIKGDLKLNKNINKYLDLCLKCNKCTEYCPSEINALDIILTAKSEYFRNSLEGKLYGLLESKYIFGTFLFLAEKIFSIFTPKYKSEKYDKKAVYFGGCINKLHPNINNFAKQILNKMEIEVIDTDFDCCGMPFLTTGNTDRFMEVLNKNIRKLPENIDYLITDCASCNWVWREYSKYSKDEEIQEKLKNLKIISIYELIAKSGIKFISKKPTSVTYHKPCHEENEYAIELLKNIENIEYKELKGYDECCGFAGFEHPHTLKKTAPIYNNKKENIKNTKSNYVLTSCAGCLISLSILSRLKQKVRRVISYLKDNCKIK